MLFRQRYTLHRRTTPIVYTHAKIYVEEHFLRNTLICECSVQCHIVVVDARSFCQLLLVNSG